MEICVEDREEPVVDYGGVVEDAVDDPLAPVMFATTLIPAATEMNDDQSRAVLPNEGDFFVVQLPTELPKSLRRREDEGRPRDDQAANGCRLDTEALTRLAPGVIGQLRVHKSGKVTLRLGDDDDFDVTNGLECSMLQQAAAIDDACFTLLGDVTKKILVTVPAEEDLDDEEARAQHFSS